MSVRLSVRHRYFGAVKYHLQDFVNNPRLVDDCDDQILMESRQLLASEKYFGERQADDSIYLQHILVKDNLSEGEPWDWSNAVDDAESPASARNLLRWLVLNKLNGHNFYWHWRGGQDMEWEKFLQRYPATEQTAL